MEIAAADIQVAKDRVLVELIDDYAEKTTGSGIIVQEVKHRGAPYRGRVLQLGQDVKELEVGQIVIFPGLTYRGVKLGEQECAVLKFEEIQGILDED